MIIYRINFTYSNCFKCLKKDYFGLMLFEIFIENLKKGKILMEEDN